MARFDVAIVGTGHNAMVVGGYLAKSGLRVVLLERRHEAGGGLSTEEVTIPGFRHNLHSVFHVGATSPTPGVSLWPWWNDLELGRFGSRYITPEVSCGTPFSDGKCILVYSGWDNVDRTCKSFARFSPKDADAYRRLCEFNKKLLVKGMLAYEDYAGPPMPLHERQDLLTRSKLGEEYWPTCTIPPRRYLEENFEDTHVKAMLLYDMVVATTWDDLPDPRGWLLKTINGWQSSAAMARGGSHTTAHALARAIAAYGGLILENAHVSNILVRNGAVGGVRLSNGREIETKIVVSGVDTKQTLLTMVGEEHLDSDLAQKIRTIKSGCGGRGVLFGAHMALHNPPKFSSANFNPDINRAWNLNIGCEDPDGFQTHWRQIESGIPPIEPGCQSAVLTLFDSTQAPPGKHTAFMWQYAPFDLKDGGAEAWDVVKDEYLDVCIATWLRYAPNFADENIIGKFAYTPLDIVRKHINMCRGDYGMETVLPEQSYQNRPTPELSGYRTPIKGLYLCGANTHPGPSILGASGFNVVNTIADDLGIRKWWKTFDLRNMYDGLREL